MTIEVTQIDNDIPVPATKERTIRLSRYPVKQLEVGESFSFPAGKRGSVQTLASHIKRSTGREFTVHKEDDQTCRIWRTA